MKPFLRVSAVLVLGCIAGALSLPAQDLRVTSTHAIFPTYGGRVSWGARNNLLAYDSPQFNGYYDVYTSNPDGSNPVCLTCTFATINQRTVYSKGDPVWDHTNDFLAIQVQYAYSAPSDSLYTPGAGAGNDLYIMNAAGTAFWQVTQNAPGILHPRFSHDGTKLLWVQRVTGDNWNLILADYAVVNGIPTVTNPQSLPPCASGVFCETGGFSLDDSIVFFSGTLEGQPLSGLDVYSYDLNSHVTTNLSNSTDSWDEFPYSLPNQNKLVWMSGKKFAGAVLQTEYWMMNYDGSNKIQLTWFNDAAAPSFYLGGISCARMEWSPDGTQMAAHLIPNNTSVLVAGEIRLIDVENAVPSLSAASYRRPPVGLDSIVTTFAPNIAAGMASTLTTDLPTNLGGVTITLTDAQNQSFPVPLFFVSEQQLNWLMPHGAAPGPATISIANMQGSTVRDTVDVEAVGPGIFTANADGMGVPVAQLLTYTGSARTAVQTSYSCSGGSGTCVATPLALGGAGTTSYLVLAATGLRHYSAMPVLQIGSLFVTAAFAGAQPVYPGLDQVNVQIPQSLAGAGSVDVSLTVDGRASNTVTLQFQ